MARPLPLLSQERLKELFSYDADTGILTWKPRNDIDPAFNGRFAGKPAGNLSGRSWGVMIDRRRFQYHRVIWKMVYDTEPPEIDHINGNSSDNRLANLRAASRLTNARNRGPTKGRVLPKGVTRQRGCVSYNVSIRINGKTKRFGRYATPEAAHAAYLAMAKAEWGEWARDADISGGTAG